MSVPICEKTVHVLYSVAPFWYGAECAGSLHIELASEIAHTSHISDRAVKVLSLTRRTRRDFDVARDSATRIRACGRRAATNALGRPHDLLYRGLHYYDLPCARATRSPEYAQLSLIHKNLHSNFDSLLSKRGKLKRANAVARLESKLRVLLASAACVLNDVGAAGVGNDISDDAIIVMQRNVLQRMSELAYAALSASARASLQKVCDSMRRKCRKEQWSDEGDDMLRDALRRRCGVALKTGTGWLY